MSGCGKLARLTFKSGDEYAIKLSRLATKSDEIAKKAIYEAAEVVADKIKDNIEKLPEDSFRYLQKGEKFSGIPARQKKDLIDSFGITPMDKDSDGWNVKIGFDGYGGSPTEKYPKGLPNQLLARAVESGSSVRQKTPFVRPAVNATRKLAVKKMNEVISKEVKKAMEG